MYYDLIIVARSSSERLIRMTQNCINSAGDCNVILIETGDNYEYYGVNKLLRYTGEFNYHHALNMGLQFASNGIHILANNDLVFYDGWERIGEDMEANGFDSASAWYQGCKFPAGDHIYAGYDIAVHLTGWCLFITKEAMNKIGKLREDVEFWYSDNLYALQLREHGLRHGMFCNVRVDHIGSQTLKTMPLKIMRQYSEGQIAKFNKSCRERRVSQR